MIDETPKQRDRRLASNRKYTTERRANDPEWVEQRRAYAREYYVRNRERIRAHQNNPEQRKRKREYVKNLRANDPKYREYLRKKQKEHVEQNREQYAKNNREWRLRTQYGLTTDQYDALVAEQGGLCAICKQSRKLHIDHCHESGVVRGLLCGPCNRALGLFGDTPAGLMRAVKYLRDAQKRQQLSLFDKDGT